MTSARRFAASTTQFSASPRRKTLKGESEGGFYSAFTGRGAVNGLEITDDQATVLIDLSVGILDELPNEPSADQSQLFNLQLYGAAFQVASVDTVQITIAGECSPDAIWYGDDGCSMTREFYESLWPGVPVVGTR